MNPIFIGLFFVVFAVVMQRVSEGMKEKRSGNEKYQKLLEDFTAEVNGMLVPGERLVACCGYNPCAAVTNRRLLIGSKKGIRSVSFSQIRKVRGMNASGSTVKNPENMMVLEIKADKNYAIGNQSAGFSQVVHALNHYVTAG